MPLQATSGAASYDAFGGGVAVVPKYIEEYFSTFLYTGNNTSQTITNGIDLSTKGGLVWIKSRAGTYVREHYLYDTARGTILSLSTDTTGANVNNSPNGVSAYNTTGFDIVGSLGSGGNGTGTTYTSWSWAKAPKFFDVVTWTGDGTNNRAISHSIGGTVGCLIVKKTSGIGDWPVWHRSLPAYGANPQSKSTLYLNATLGGDADVYFGSTAPTATAFYVDVAANASGATYVAYIFAHNAGGFGLTGTDNVISCGAVTADGSGNATVNLGYEPQWILVKRSDGVNSWAIVDTMRGLPADGSARFLFANNSNAESGGGLVNINATGFYANATLSASATYIYIAIRRGPMKVPTSGTSVFSPVTRTGTGTDTTISGVGFAPDAVISKTRGVGPPTWWDKLRGAYPWLKSSATDAEGTTTTNALLSYTNDGVNVGTDGNQGNINYSGFDYITYFLRRAPSFFDEVCYTGDSTNNRQVVHNLGVEPALVIVKNRSAVKNWIVGGSILPWSNTIFLNLTDAAFPNSGASYITAGSSTTFTVNDNSNVNNTGNNYVAYLFATCAGVSKVGSYTGTGSTQTVNCGFSGGARFVMIKRTDSTGSWYVWDVARGISSGNDPYLLLNSTAAEVTNTDYIDAYSAGFEISSTAPAEINASGGSFIFLAIS